MTALYLGAIGAAPFIVEFFTASSCVLETRPLCLGAVTGVRQLIATLV